MSTLKKVSIVGSISLTQNVEISIISYVIAGKKCFAILLRYPVAPPISKTVALVKSPPELTNLSNFSLAVPLNGTDSPSCSPGKFSSCYSTIPVIGITIF
jgi:hypothetical protein